MKKTYIKPLFRTRSVTICKSYLISPNSLYQDPVDSEPQDEYESEDYDDDYWGY